MDETIWPSASISSRRPIRTKTSSAGLKDMAPPQAMQPPTVSTTRRTDAASRFTGASVSMVSAVPAGEVIARDEVLGMIMPSAAQMATTIGVVRLPGRPPTQCLSIMTDWGHESRWPTSTIARVSSVISAPSSGKAEQAATKAAS